MDSLIPIHQRAAIEPSGIEGLWSAQLAEIPTHGGPVLHMLRSDSPLFSAFGEIYFSSVEPGAVKAWKLHQAQSQNFAVPHGLIRVVVYDEREGSPTRGELCSFTLGRPGHYRLLHIPPRLWYGFACLGDAGAVLANCADLPHSPEEALRMGQDDPRIPYQWRRHESDRHA
jgi:dTDP-4-dehydrorhamnose 3,5-epimerase